MIRVGILAALFTLAVLSAQAAPAFDRAGWRADLAQLRDAMSTNSANLEWAVSGRGMDLKATYTAAERGLDDAQDDASARKALEKFVSAFADGHFEINWPEPQATVTDAKGQSLCSRLGFFDVSESGAIAPHLPGYVPLANAAAPHIPAGLIAAGGKNIAVLRIPVFTPQGIPSLCAPAIRSLHLAPDSPCDSPCQSRVMMAADQIFLDEVQSQLRLLAARKPDALLIDLAGNGGGDDTAIAIARMITDRPLATPRMGFVRGNAWAAALVEDQATVEQALRETGDAQADLLKFKSELAVAVQAAKTPCDRAPLWDDKPIACSQIVTTPLYAGGLSQFDLPTDLRGHSWSNNLSATASFHYTQGLWRGPVIVLVDGNTASSSELMTAMLQDNHAALVIGAPTYGAGC
ncbi:MAG TPA: S41 family peptidase, partial [Rhizomicrobium sp.]|nr:S41 family peptidase [Rhizomicrobium sp.]